MSRVQPPATAFERQTAPRHPRQNDESHLKFIRSLPCLVTGRPNVDPCHIRFADPRFGKHYPGIGAKSDDKWTVPLIRAVHDAQHLSNEIKFWAKLCVDPCVVAAALWINTADYHTAIVILREARRLIPEDQLARFIGGGR